MPAKLLYNRPFSSFTPGEEENKSLDVFAKRFRDASELLGEHPNADAGVPSAEGQTNQGADAPFYVLGSGAIFKNDQAAVAGEKDFADLQPPFNFRVFAGNDKDSRVFLRKVEVRAVVEKGWADENDVLKLPAKRAFKQAPKVNSFTAGGWPDDERVEREA